MQRLSATVKSLQLGGRDPAHSGVVVALRELANALEPLQEVPPTTAPQLRDFARQLADSSASSSGRAESLKRALRLVLQVLRNRPPPERQGEAYERALTALDQAVDKLQPERSVIDQQTPILVALRSATNAVSVAMGQPLPFPEAQPPPPSAAIGSVDQEFEHARQRLAELAAVSWTDRRLSSAHALSALANLIESLDRQKRVASARVSTIRAQATRLQDADSLSFTRMEWIRSGLAAALDALEDLGVADARGMAQWLQSARQGVERLQAGGSIAFQAAAIQDAFRTTLDAFQAGLTPACGSGSDGAHDRHASASPLPDVGFRSSIVLCRSR